jgi:hypothetical protein
MIENRSSPQASVIPVLAYPDVGEACEWLSAAFGFTVRLRIADHRAQLLYGDGAVIVTEGGPATDTKHSSTSGSRTPTVIATRPRARRF